MDLKDFVHLLCIIFDIYNFFHDFREVLMTFKTSMYLSFQFSFTQDYASGMSSYAKRINYFALVAFDMFDFKVIFTNNLNSYSLSCIYVCLSEQVLEVVVFTP